MNHRLLRQWFGGVLFLLFLTGCTAGPLTITFKGGTCTYEGPTSVGFDKFSVNMVIEVEKPTTTGYVMVTLADGKTEKDLDAWQTYDPPSWATMIYDNGIIDANSGTTTRTYHLSEPMTYQGGPLYFVCFQAHPDSGELVKAGAFGPIKVRK